MALFIGIDPGLSGGIACVSQDGSVLYAEAMPHTERDILDVFMDYPDQAKVAVLERVRSSPQMGVVSAFTFGAGYGGLRMALAAARIAYDEVTPQKWQLAMGCRTKGDKNVSKRRASELFPNVKCTHAISDSLLLAEYCRRLGSQR